MQPASDLCPIDPANYGSISNPVWPHLNSNVSLPHDGIGTHPGTKHGALGSLLERVQPDPTDFGRPKPKFPRLGAVIRFRGCV
jgi:hypothetical protein